MYNKRITTLVLSIILVLSITGCSNNTESDTKPADNQVNISADDIMGDKYLSDNTEDESNVEQDLGEIINETDSNQDTENPSSDESQLSNIIDIVVIDCNGSDSTLIHSDYGNILIDFGSKDSINTIKNVIDNKGIKDIDLAILTHAHSDHYGGLSDIIEDYNVSKLIMTNTGDISIEYEDTIKYIEESNIEVEASKVGNNYTVGDISIKVIGPSIDYEETDENSIVTLLKYKDFDMLLTGSAGMIAEKDYVQYLSDIEVFTVGRHGNSRTTSDNLLETSTPNVGIISCTSDSISQEVLNKLAKYNIDTLRTDENGTITIKTDGKEYNLIYGDSEQRYITDENYSGEEPIETNQDNKIENNQNNENNDNSIEYVYTSPTSKYYHSTDKCSKLLIAKDKNKVTLEEAISSGAEKCPRCW